MRPKPPSAQQTRGLTRRSPNRDRSARPSPDHGRHLSNLWTVQHATWEAEGRWQNLVDHVLHLEEPTLFWLSVGTRAALMCGRSDLAGEWLSELRQSREIPIKALMRLHLSEGILLRREGHWTRSKLRTLRALSFAVRTNDSQLIEDARFAVAICLAEEGRPFKALDLFRTVRSSQAASQYRRDRAAINEAWLLWDTGQPHAARRILNTLGAETQPRLGMMLDMLEGREETPRRLLLDSVVSSLPLSELDQLALLLMEWALVSDRENRMRAVRESWIPKHLGGSTHFLSTFYVSVWEKHEPVVPPKESDGWRNALEQRFLALLSWLPHDPRRALSIYRESIDPLLEREALATPLICHSNELEGASSPFLRDLSRGLGLRASSKLESASNRKASVQGTALVIHSGTLAWTLDLSKSPTSLTLLRSLAGPPGRKITKQTLHEHLTGTRYSPRLHDSRLHKLLTRLSERVRGECGFDLWILPGTNEIVLVHEVEL